MDLSSLSAHDLMHKLDEYIHLYSDLLTEKIVKQQELDDLNIEIKRFYNSKVVEYAKSNTYNLSIRMAELELTEDLLPRQAALSREFGQIEDKCRVLDKAMSAIRSIAFVRDRELRTLGA